MNDFDAKEIKIEFSPTCDEESTFDASTDIKTEPSPVPDDGLHRFEIKQEELARLQESVRIAGTETGDEELLARLQSENMAFPPTSPPSDQVSVRDRYFTTMLIAAYRDCPELWRVKSEGYFNKHRKAIALEKIVDALKQYKPDLTVEHLKKKINTLRTNFNKDYNHIQTMKRSGVAPEDIPQPNAWYYNDLMFIKDQFKTTENQSLENQMSIDEKSPLASIKQPSPIHIALPPPSKKKKQSPQNSTEELLNVAIAYFKRSETELDLLAKTWAIKLSKMVPDQRRLAEKFINDILFEAEMGKLTMDCVQFFTSSFSHSPLASHSQRCCSRCGSSTSLNESHLSMNHTSSPNHVNSNNNTPNKSKRPLQPF